jgi:arabinose-5-phosphate isomerase
MRQQAQALQDLAGRLGSSVLETLNRMKSIPGRVVITGMGKSGHIAAKVAATLSSTGTPSIFVHPTESLHGDLGMITSQDLVIIISKSGENPELNLMIPTLKRMKVPMVALTGNPKSSLARLVDIVIDLGEIQEICPLDLAPTTSATLCLVLLDSMAMELMRWRGFKAQDYALFHPGGRLGRRLLFSVGDLMVTGSELPKVSVEAPIKSVLHEMTRGMMGAVLICALDDQLLGLITDNDIRRILENQENFFQLKASNVMNAQPSTCLDTENAYEVLLKMRQRAKPITLMPVLDIAGKAVGVLRLETMVQQGLV